MIEFRYAICSYFVTRVDEVRIVRKYLCVRRYSLLRTRAKVVFR
jgi:hypothetical protein